MCNNPDATFLTSLDNFIWKLSRTFVYLFYTTAKRLFVYPDCEPGNNPPNNDLMIELKIPVADTRYVRICGSPTHKVRLDEDKLEIIYNYEYQNYIDADNPELGVADPIKRMLEEYVIERDAIHTFALIRDEGEQVFTVGIDTGAILYDVSISFIHLKDAREFRSKLIDWRFNAAK